MYEKSNTMLLLWNIGDVAELYDKSSDNPKSIDNQNFLCSTYDSVTREFKTDMKSKVGWSVVWTPPELHTGDHQLCKCNLSRHSGTSCI